MTAVGENIKNIRKKLGITQEELAEKINVTRQAVSNWENGKTEPDLETISSIAEVFGIDSYELINDKPLKKIDLYKKSKYFPVAIIFGVVFITGLIVSIFLEKPALELRNEYYEAELYIFLKYMLKPLIGLSFGISFAFFSQIFTGFYIKNKVLKFFVLIIGIIFAILTTCFVIHFLLVMNVGLPLPLHFSNVVLFYQSEIVFDNPILNAIAPILIFYGIISKKEGEKL